MNDVVVFLGPSLPRAAAEELLPGAIYLPPVAQADVLSAIDLYQPRVIAIIDGVFGQDLAVWHKEILTALERGVVVCGSSSMGALRAAEMDHLGMVGIGDVYEAYRDGVLVDEDEVALAFVLDAEDYKNLSMPMVNVRATLRAAVDRGALDPAVASAVVDTAKSVYYPDRSVPAIAERLANDDKLAPATAAVKDALANAYVDVKGADAAKLLSAIAAGTITTPGTTSRASVSDTRLLRGLDRCDRYIKRSGVCVRLQELANFTTVHHREATDLVYTAMNRALALVLASELDVQVSASDVAAERELFRESRQLTEDAALAGWLRGNGLTEARFEELLREEATLRRLRQWYVASRFPERNVQPLLDMLRLRDEFDEWAERKAAQQRTLALGHVADDGPLLDSEDVTALVVDHARATGWRPTGSLEDWVVEAGFESFDLFVTELQQARGARLARLGTETG